MRGIYKITNTNNGKCYIGKSEDLGKRLKYHITSLKHGNNKNQHMQNAYFYNSGSFIIEILEELSSEEDINEREKYWIKYYSSNDRNFGYNKTEGGDGGNSYYDYLTDEEKERIHSEASARIREDKNPNYNKHCFTDGETIKYITDEEIDEYLNNGWVPGVPNYVREKERISNNGDKNGFYGKHHTDETKKRLSAQRSGENNWNYGRIIMHKEGKQKYVLPDDVKYYLDNGWEKGILPEIKEKMSKNKKGIKTGIHSKNVKKYGYNEMIFYGWRDLKSYLNCNGYPKISEQSIVKIANGISVRGYEELLGKIILV